VRLLSELSERFVTRACPRIVSGVTARGFFGKLAQDPARVAFRAWIP
jgi:hypothetical protein